MLRLGGLGILCPILLGIVAHLPYYITMENLIQVVKWWALWWLNKWLEMPRPVQVNLDKRVQIRREIKIFFSLLRQRLYYLHQATPWVCRHLQLKGWSKGISLDLKPQFFSAEIWISEWGQVLIVEATLLLQDINYVFLLYRQTTRSSDIGLTSVHICFLLLWNDCHLSRWLMISSER